MRECLPCVGTALAAALPFVVATASAPHSTSDVRAELLAVPISEKLGGDTTRVVASDKAFTFLATNAPPERQRAFFFGNRLFNTNWVKSPPR
jgi:CxxC motif-containing protein (DUF1111 family)